MTAPDWTDIVGYKRFIGVGFFTDQQQKDLHRIFNRNFSGILKPALTPCTEIQAMKTRKLALVVSVAAVFVGVLAAVLIPNLRPWGHTYAGTLIDPPHSVEDFTLTDQHGQAFRLSDERNRLVLIYFGYTYCPDVCPMTLADMLRVKQILRSKAEAITFLMITVDPERDSPKALGQRLTVFDPNFVGLTGDKATLQRVWNDFGVYVEREETQGRAAGYLMAHSASLYLVDPQKRLRLIFPFGAKPEAIASDIVHILQ
jgi:protein SCO1/2